MEKKCIFYYLLKLVNYYKLCWEKNKEMNKKVVKRQGDAVDKEKKIYICK